MAKIIELIYEDGHLKDGRRVRRFCRKDGVVIFEKIEDSTVYDRLDEVDLPF